MNDELDLYRDIGNGIKARRLEKGLTQEELAKLLDLQRASIINYEKGSQKVPIHVLYKICEKLELAITDLLPKPDNRQYISTSAGTVELSSDTVELINELRSKL